MCKLRFLLNSADIQFLVKRHLDKNKGKVNKETLVIIVCYQTTQKYLQLHVHEAIRQ